MNHWVVAVISKDRAAKRYNTSRLDIGLITRREDAGKSGEELYYIRKSHIISPGDEFVDLSVPEYQEALRRTEHLWSDKGKEGTPSFPGGEVVRNTIRKARPAPAAALLS